MTGALHVAAAAVALVVGAAVLVQTKGGPVHVALGRLFLAAMLLVNVPALLLYDDTGLPGPFHVLAVVSLVTTTLGWRAVRRGRSGVGAHAALMTWSWIGVTTAGLAQLANRMWPEHAPWPVAIVVLLTTVVGLVVVPRSVAGQLVRRPRQRSVRSAALCARR